MPTFYSSAYNIAFHSAVPSAISSKGRVSEKSAPYINITIKI
jgi:hypothetical protein